MFQIRLSGRPARRKTDNGVILVIPLPEAHGNLFFNLLHPVIFQDHKLLVGRGFHFKPVQRNCRSRTDNLTEPIRRSDRFTVGTYPAGNDISTDITKYVLRDANGYPYGIDRDA